MSYKKVILALTICLDYITADPSTEVIRGYEKFASELLPITGNYSDNDKGNIIISPLSAHIVLTTAALGAKGVTQIEMINSLHLPNNRDHIIDGSRELVNNLNTLELVNATLELANKIYVTNNFEIFDDYLNITRTVFNSELSLLDSNTEKSVETINNWVKENTHGKINNIVTSNSIPKRGLMLLNAVYFKGNWANKFNKSDTKKREFYVHPLHSKLVDTMSVEGTYRYGQLPNLRASFIEIPYESEDMKMVIIRPNHINGLNNIMYNLGSFTNEIMEMSGHFTLINLLLPKFKIENTIDLMTPLRRLGMKRMFENGANFNNMAREAIKIDSIRQKAYIRVDEEGSEAASVTVKKINIRSLGGPKPTPVFPIDRPFVFMIKKGNLNIFLGIVVEPSM